MRRIWLIGLLLWMAVALTACGSTQAAMSTPSASSSPSVPPPDLALLVPANYRVMRVLTGALDGTAVPNVIVQSAGPIDEYGCHRQDVQVLAWDPIARRWIVAFDARKVTMPDYADSNWWPPSYSGAGPSETILPKDRADLVHQLKVVTLGPQAQPALVFNADVNAGANEPSVIVVVDFSQGEAQLAYTWFGDDLPRLAVSGPAGSQRIAVTADLFTVVDPLSTPARRYHFVLSSTSEGVKVTSDDRPWLGIYASDTGLSAASALPIEGTVPGSPAARLLRRGDQLLAVDNEPIPSAVYSLGPYVVDQLERHHAHEQVEFTVERAGSILHLSVRLGSLLDPSAQNLTAPSDVSELVL